MGEHHNIWEHYQGIGVRAFAANEGRLVWLASLAQAGSRVLNIGAGNGRLEELCLARGAEVWSADPGPKSVENLRGRLGLGERAVVASAEKLPFPADFFDTVVMSEVLEHLPPETLRPAFEEARRVLRPGGRFCGTVPWAEDLSELETICPRCGEIFHRWGHRQSFTPETLAAELRRVFGAVSAVKKLFVPWRVLNWKGRLQGAFNTVLFRMGLLGDSRLSIFFDCRK